MLINVSCKQCGSNFDREERRVLRAQNSFCSVPCSSLFKVGHLRGSKNPHYKDGFSGKRFGTIYYNMLARCNNPKQWNYSYYGGRGIKIEWKNIREFADDMLSSYEKHCKEYGEKDTTLDRIDNDGNYGPENCRWATKYEQSNNARSNILVTHEGKTQTLKQWSREKGISYQTMHSRHIQNRELFSKPREIKKI